MQKYRIQPNLLLCKKKITTKKQNKTIDLMHNFVHFVWHSTRQGVCMKHFSYLNKNVYCGYYLEVPP